MARSASVFAITVVTLLAGQALSALDTADTADCQPIVGRVVDRELGRPLSGVEVTTERGEVVTTDDGGRFELCVERPGQMALRLELEGYVSRERVIDFLLFHVGEHYWPAFNVADSIICVSIAVLVVTTLREHDDGESSEAGGS